MKSATHRHFEGTRLVVATHNRGKLRELSAMFDVFHIETVPAAALSLPEPVEDGVTFAENAAIKAHAAASASGWPALADDSGLSIDALGGAPGVHTVDWMGPNKEDTVAIARAMRELANVPSQKRTARMTSSLCLAWPDGHAEAFEGVVTGRLVFPPRGTFGFGFDPVFVPDGETKTFAELGPDGKARFSHRARAFRALIAACFYPSTGSG
jgi:XTP/dITP diphosphohydrolase